MKKLLTVIPDSIRPASVSSCKLLLLLVNRECTKAGFYAVSRRQLEIPHRLENRGGCSLLALSLFRFGIGPLSFSFVQI